MATGNWWASAPSVPEDINDNVDAGSPLTSDPTANYATGDYNDVNSPCAMLPVVDFPPLVCPSASMSSTTDTDDCPSTLADFGIVLEGTWSPFESIDILEAARNTGAALLAAGVTADNAVEAFRVVMEGKNEVNEWRQIRLYRSALSGVYCDTTSLSDGEYSASIACHPNVAITQYTIVHEFGHVFDGHTGGAFRELVEDPDREASSNRLNNLNGELVFGVRGYLLIGGAELDWQRSDIDFDNGWGSAALWNEQSYWGPYEVLNTLPTPSISQRLIPKIGPCGAGQPIPTAISTYATPDASPFNFQQNPCTYPDWEATLGLTLETYEAAGDMFLNWVYWKNYGPPSLMPIGIPTPSGFGDTFWRVDQSYNNCYPTGCSDSGLSGQARGSWMDQVMNALFDDFGW